MIFSSKKSRLPSPDEALPGRDTPLRKPENHVITGHRITPPFPEGLEQAMFALGCFWGAEKKFWQQPGVYCTAAGYAGGYTPNPTYEEVCTGQTGHAEVVKVVFDPKIISYQQLLIIFWESHNPTQGMKQGADVGTQYRSVIYTYSEEQQQAALASKNHYQQRLKTAGFGAITTEIHPAPTFYYAEVYHQQYLAKTPRLSSCDIPLSHTGRPTYR
ncbi:peptide-methionine (S)-S-oxide reductase MsrA [Methylomarinum sp. Ch1-1]|uniref:Peptide methionine sulfoxide reductase MsrA n=1 Tax=Methylomarinum roseum TaxID=3067653 RepID=A0AAU7NZ12_9GAMM|nr:peptide-methionine (S)-S-oxide reductase MsrA [Methylomarinum sp. Ch1-1]MDP4521655.1 peptide-methionine (S)-S-oxide reductase MsrA [Methylomarinum sp. Ch1-1]